MTAAALACALAALAFGASEDAASLRRALETAPSDPAVNVKLCHALERAADYEAAKAQCRAALALSGLSDPQKAEAHGTLANALAKTGSKEAVDEFRRALESAPGSSDLRSNLGFILVKLKRFGEAEPECRRASKEDPKNDLAFQCLGVALLKTDRADEAVPALREAVKLNPANAVSAIQLADALTALDQDDEARWLYQGQVERGASLGYFGLGRLLAKQGRKKEGRAFLEKFLELEAKTPYYQEEKAEAKALAKRLR